MIRDSYIPYREQIVDTDIPSYSSEEIASLMDDPKSDVWLAEENGEIAGMAAGTELGPCAYHLKMLFVSGHSQHKGVGGALLERFESRDAELHFSLLTANFLDPAKWFRDHSVQELLTFALGGTDHVIFGSKNKDHIRELLTCV